LKKFLLIAVASLMAVACDKDNNNNPIDNVREALEEKDLQNKTFQSECNLEPLDAILTGILTGGQASVKSSRTQYRFVGANITRTTILYAQTDCVGDAFTFNETGAFNVSKNQKTNDGGYFIDINFNKLMLKMDSDVGVQSANAIKLCGASDWAVGQEREVTAQAKDMSCYGATVPRTDLNIYRVDEGNVLYLGTPSKDSNQARPTSLSKVKYTGK